MSDQRSSLDRPSARLTKRWRIGDVTVTRIVERGGRPMPASIIFGSADAPFVQQHAWLAPHFAAADGRIYTVVQAFVIESCGRRIIVDTCIGNDKPRATPMFNMLQTAFLEDLASAGFLPESLDTVLCTHLHVDHVGWNTRWVDGRWQPTFTKARYLLGRIEHEYWLGDTARADDGDVLGDSIAPVMAAGLVDLVEMNEVLTDEVRLLPTAGHTPGHVSVVIESRGLRAIITGDVLHHPIQCCAPDLASNFDVDADAARFTRRRFLADFADRPVVIFGSHFADPTAGWIKQSGDAWRFEILSAAELNSMESTPKRE